MKVLVIGGTLFIGRSLVEELVKAGHDVAVLHRQPKHDFGRRVENMVADRNDAESVREALSGRRFEVVFDNVYDWERGTTAAQVEATVRACGDRLSRYIFMSSVSAYGDGLNHKESDPLAPDSHSHPYIRYKASTERLLFRMHARHGLPVVTFRPPFVYGPNNPFYREQFFWDRLRAGRPIIIPGDGYRLMQFVYVGDLVAAMLRAMVEPRAVGEAFNIGNPRSTLTIWNLAREVVRLAGSTSAIRLVPWDFADVELRIPDIGKARKLLGYEPRVDLEEGLVRTIAWYRERVR